MEINRKNSTKISWIQFISAIIIIFDHCFDYIDYEHTTKGVFENIIYFLTRLLNKGLPYCAMAVFFFLSSLLLYKDWEEKKDITGWYLKKIRTRFKSIFIPYLLWNLIWAVIFIGAGLLGTDHSKSFSVNTIINELISSVLFAKYNEVFWFMKTLIIYIIISPIIGLLAEKLKSWILVFGFILSVIPDLFTGELLIFANFHNLFFWSLGAYISINASSINKKVRTAVHSEKHTLYFSTLVISLVLITFIQGTDIKQHVSYVIRAVLNCSVLFSSIIGSVCYYNLVTHLLEDQSVKWYTRTSFLIYAMHKPVEQAFNKVIARIFPASLGAHLLNLFGGAVFTLTAVLVAIRIMMTIIPKTTLILNGGRSIFD